MKNQLRSPLLSGASPPKKGSTGTTAVAAIVTVFIIAVLSAGLSAQTLSPRVTASSGGYFSNTSGSLSVTVGETATRTYLTTGRILTQGFMQPELFLLTGTVTGPFCAGSSVAVPFSASGYFGSMNVFTAELSDATGSFSSSATIGSVTSVQSGSIAATIPVNTPSGSGYRIRVVSHFPVFVGKNNGTDISIDTAPTSTIMVSPSPTVAGHAPNTIYLGFGPQSVTLSASSGTSYSWSSNPAGFSSSVQNPTVSPLQTTTYTVTVTNSFGCLSTACVTISVLDWRCGINNTKIMLCHNDHTICVASSAVSSHLDHGDYLGGCSIPKDLITGIPESHGFELEQNYPNPFNAHTTIRYKVPAECFVILRVFDLFGREVRTLVNRLHSPGNYYAAFNASELPGGMYFYTLESNEVTLKRMMVFLE